MEIKLTGWKGLLAALVVLGFVGFRYVTAVQTLESDGRAAVREWIAAEYQRYHLARGEISDEQKAAILLTTRQVELVSMEARGKPERMAVRVEIEPNDAHPPGSPHVRYFNLEYSIATGWRHRGDISAMQYHLTSLW